MNAALKCVAALIAAAGCLGAGTLQALPRPDHVVIVIEENHSYDEILGSQSCTSPYINSLARKGANMVNSFAVTHPSQPNYLAFFSGTTQGNQDDECPQTFRGANLAASLLAAGLTFGGYSEDLPERGSTACNGEEHGYVRKHAPWANWQAKGGFPPALSMPFQDAFPKGPDFASLPTVSIVIPNLAHDMHDGTPMQGDEWLQEHLDAYYHWAMTHNSLLIITFDEDDKAGLNQIPTLILGPMVIPAHYPQRIDHYNMLRTLLDMYGLKAFNEAVKAKPIDYIFAK